MPSHNHGAIVDGIDEKSITTTNEIATVTGYASVFNNRDLGNDIVMPGAYAKSLRENGLPVVLFNHKRDDVPVGTCIDAKEDRRGLWVKIELPLEDTFVSSRLLPQLRRKGLKGMSVGYSVPAGGSEWREGVRYLKQIRLYECSFVSMPMNPEAGIETIKNMSTEQLANALEDLARSARQLMEVARAEPISDLAAATKAMKAFIAEATRDRPHLRDPITRAEQALTMAQARLERLRCAASR
jgi:HK97 family phage prohead protease